MAGKSVMDIKIEGVKKLSEDIPHNLKTGQREFVRKFADAMAQEITKASPKGHILWTGEVKGKDSAVMSSKHPGAKALDKGAYIAAKKGKSLRFSSGGREAFPKFVRLPARHYTRKALRSRNRIATKLWKQFVDGIT